MCEGPTSVADPRAVPAFARRSNLLRGAYGFARWAHHGPRREGDTNIDHPVAVAELLAKARFEDEVVAAALLHDVVEDTSTDASEIKARFGPAVGSLVEEMTENEAIREYRARKAEHRARVARDPRVAAIYAADKLANARAKGGSEPTQEQLEHYLQTLGTLCSTHPELPFLAPLRDELGRLVAERRLG